MNSLKDIKCNIRLGSLEVNVIDTALLESLKGLYHFCPHFHLSLQSGDDSILKLMNRHYTQSEFYDKVILIRRYFPDAAITTDVIVGFPTETEEQFDNTCNFIKKVNFADVHVFPYSKREGTRAYKLKTVSFKIMDVRVLKMSEIKAELKRNYDGKFIGKNVLVLTEEHDNGYTIGYTDNYIRVYIEGNLTLNEFIEAKPTEIFKDGLKAKKEII
jgi:threonylcarbamoyladenosine tRNA methylthiotransferase MtaB